MSMLHLIVHAPTLNEKAVKPKRLKLTAMAVMLSGLVLTVIIVVRAPLRAFDDSDGAEKNRAHS
jgi:hypothetical protein